MGKFELKLNYDFKEHNNNKKTYVILGANQKNSASNDANKKCLITKYVGFLKDNKFGIATKRIETDPAYYLPELGSKIFKFENNGLPTTNRIDNKKQKRIKESVIVIGEENLRNSCDNMSNNRKKIDYKNKSPDKTRLSSYNDIAKYPLKAIPVFLRNAYSKKEVLSTSEILDPERYNKNNISKYELLKVIERRKNKEGLSGKLINEHKNIYISSLINRLKCSSPRYERNNVNDFIISPSNK
jgi:hypothetical protein